MAALTSLATLLKQTHIADDEQVLKAADAALRISKGDLEAQHVKVVALLKLDRYDEAIQALEAGGEKLKQRASLEYAYALYKSGDPATAAEIAQKGSDRGFQHVEAQARYRREDFARSAELYRKLASDSQSDADADLRINGGAVDAQLEWSGRGDLVREKKPTREHLDAFETAYNAACGSIARGELGQGEVLLKRAKDLCKALEDLSDQEKQAEMLPITVQQIYVSTRLGKLEEANSLTQGIDIKSIPDASTRHIAQMNRIAAFPTSHNPYLTQRLVNSDLSFLKTDYPFSFQSHGLKRNRYASDLQCLKYDGTADSTQETVSKQPAPNTDALSNSLSAINAAADARNRTGKEALKHILPVLEKRPNDVGLLLTIVQLYVLTGNPSSATILLEGVFSRLEQSGSAAEQDVRFAPGLVGVLVGLYERQGRKSHMRTEYTKAATHWRRKSKPLPFGVSSLLRAAGGCLLDSSEPEQQKLAGDIFKELHQSDPSDRYAAAGFLAASAQTGSGNQTTALTPLDRLISGVDVNALESAGIAQPPSSGAAVVTGRKRPGSETKPKKSKKIRKDRIPKDYDPNKKPDPERWLPLRDRSSYRPKGKKGKARQALLSQGAVATESDGSRPATPGADVIKQKQIGGAGGAKKKKGKGGKW